MTDTTAEPGTYLTFRLNEETFGVKIDRVREIVEVDSAITPVPRTPAFMKGVMNLRGNVVPVVDMNHKLGLPVTELTPESCIIIVEVGHGEEAMVLGAMVDGVEEVIEYGAKDLMAPPTGGTSLRPEFLAGLARRCDEGFVMLVRLDSVLAASKLHEFLNIEAAA